MIYYILENIKDKVYLKQVNQNTLETTKYLNLAYKFNCEKSALVFKEANKLDNFKICECSYF